MTTQSNTVNMQVPADMVGELEAYLATMNMQVADDNVEEKEMGSDYYEISRVTGARRRHDGGWQFQVVWKGYRERGWVDDEDCSCEKEISEYLRTQRVRTAYLFCRVSTKNQAQSTNVSLDAQEAELRNAVTNMTQFDRVRVYAISQSAYKRIPRILKRIGEACLPGDGILVWRVDRLSRNIEEYLEWIKDLHKRGVMLYSHHEGMTFAEKKLSFYQAVLDAHKEAYDLGERVRLSVRHKRQRGDEKVGGLPYGKKYDRVFNNDGTTHHKIVVDHPREQGVIRTIRSSRKNPEQIANDLNRNGNLKRGRRWNTKMVLRIMFSDV